MLKNSDAWRICGFLFFMAVLCGFAIYHLWPWRAPDRWAKSQQLRILGIRRVLTAHPFFFYTSPGQIIYRMVLEDATGNIIRCYLRCGSYVMGMFSSHIDVLWDPEFPSSVKQHGFPVIVKPLPLDDTQAS